MKKFATIFAALLLVAVFGSCILHKEVIPKRPESSTEKSPSTSFSIEENFPEGVKPAPKELTIIAVGDIMLSRGVAKKMKRVGDYKYPFYEVAEIMKEGDIVFANLESPITSGRVIVSKEMVFRTDPEAIEGLKWAGFNLLSLANNHTPNFGAKGLLDTMENLSGADILYVGAGKNKVQAHRPVVVEVDGLKIAFLAYTDGSIVPSYYETTDQRVGTAFMRIEEMQGDVREAKVNTDFVVVSMHTGEEYASRQNRKQEEFAHAAVEAGAGLVLGHHPHVLQPVEQYKGAYILYSLGNFVFDQMWSNKTKEGVIAKILVSGEHVKDIEFIPVKMEKLAQPKIVEGELAEAILDRLDTPLQKRLVFYRDGQNYKQTERRVLISLHEEEKQSQFRADFDGDGKKEEVFLKEGRVYVFKDGKELWKSKPAWEIENILLADLNEDGQIELSFSLWKKDEDGILKNHLYLYGWGKRGWRAFWCSSPLDAPIREMEAVDVDTDEKDELVVLEGTYQNSRSSYANYFTIWNWNGWGFFNDFRSEEGKFCQLSVKDRLISCDVDAH